MYKRQSYSSLRFYAGSPLVTSKGYSIGTLCVLGTEPKKITHDQIEGLRILADLVVGSIENDFLKKQHNGKKDAPTVNQNESLVKYFSTSSILFADFVGQRNLRTGSRMSRSTSPAIRSDLRLVHLFFRYAVFSGSHFRSNQRLDPPIF